MTQTGNATATNIVTKDTQGWLYAYAKSFLDEMSRQFGWHRSPDDGHDTGKGEG